MLLDQIDVLTVKQFSLTLDRFLKVGHNISTSQLEVTKASS